MVRLLSLNGVSDIDDDDTVAGASDVARLSHAFCCWLSFDAVDGTAAAAIRLFTSDVEFGVSTTETASHMEIECYSHFIIESLQVYLSSGPFSMLSMLQQQYVCSLRSSSLASAILKL